MCENLNNIYGNFKICEKLYTEYEIDKNYPNVEVVKNRTSDRTSNGCYAWASDMITAHPDVDAFFLYWNESSMATYNTLQAAGKTDVVVVGYDATKEQQKVMQECRIVSVWHRTCTLFGFVKNACLF